MKPRRKYEEREKIGTQILEMYRTGQYTLTSCCEANGVNYSTFRSWSAPTVICFEELNIDVQSRLLRRGFVHSVHGLLQEILLEKDYYDKEELKQSARIGLLKAVQGGYYEEIDYITKIDSNGNVVPDRIIKRQLYKPPSDKAIIYVLSRLDPMFMKPETVNVQSANLDTFIRQYENFTLEELESEADRQFKALGGT